MKLRAYAKINPGLDVTGVRSDGYHEVRMIMQTVSIFDEIELRKKDAPGIDFYSNRDDLPGDDSNLAVRAAGLLLKQFDIHFGLTIILKKNIPVAAGMAGGSTDAAAVLCGVNRLFGLGMSEKELMDIGTRIGADVPFCVMGGTALAEGIGEILTPLPDLPECPIVIAKPSAGISTKFVYQHLKLDPSLTHPDIDGMRASLTAGDLSGVTERLGNVLETVTLPAYPEIKELKEALKSSGSTGVLMSGSGPTVFGFFRDETRAKEAVRRLKNDRPDLETVMLVHPVSRNTIELYHTGETA